MPGIRYVRCPACGSIAPPRLVLTVLMPGVGTTPPEYICALCDAVQPFGADEPVEVDTEVRCGWLRCRRRFAVPRGAKLIRCPRCARWRPGPAAPRQSLLPAGLLRRPAGASRSIRR